MIRSDGDMGHDVATGYSKESVVVMRIKNVCQTMSLKGDMLS